MQIRRASTSDANVLSALAARSFIDAYRHIDDPQDIADHVAEHFTPERLRSLIGDETATVLLGSVDEALAGYAVLAESPTPDCVTGPRPIELARLYLANEFIGRGNGARLMDGVHLEARRRGAQTLWVGVYDRNVRAVEFYERVGFARVGGKVFRFGGRDYIDPVYVMTVRTSD